MLAQQNIVMNGTHTEPAGDRGTDRQADRQRGRQRGLTQQTRETAEEDNEECFCRDNTEVSGQNMI